MEWIRLSVKYDLGKKDTETFLYVKRIRKKYQISIWMKYSFP